MGSSYNVQVHQSSRAPSMSTTYSRSSGGSSSSRTPRSLTPRVYRDYDAVKHSATSSRMGSNTIINHGKRDYDPDFSSPSYSGTYSR
ncbi:hypothetical protein HJFPF1_01360 [Paramyrothecium foliicola]|nr:hypothetical protein HJFPF1_01360 [Paramyrothecium foliicola]